GDLVGDGPSLRRGRTGPAPDVEVGDEGVEVGALGEEGGHGVAHGGERGTNSTNKQACLFYSPGIANVAACASPTSTSPSEPACAPSSRPRSIPTPTSGRRRGPSRPTSSSPGPRPWVCSVSSTTPSSGARAPTTA